MYGLCDTPRACYLSVKQELIKTGETKSKYDGTIFYKHNGRKPQGILSSHVDNFFWAGTSWFFAHVRDHFWKTFVVSKDERETFKYLGLQIQQMTLKSFRKAVLKTLKPYKLIILGR